MPKSYNHAKQYHRAEERETVRAQVAEATYESYCQAVGVNVSAAREATVLFALHQLVTRDVWGQSKEK